MEPLYNLLYLLEPASLALIITAVCVVLASAFRALSHEKESERHRDLSETTMTLDSSQALMIPVASSCSLLLMFYLFASVSQLVTAFTAVAATSSLAFCLAPLASQLNSHLGLVDPLLTRGGCCGSFTRSQSLLVALSSLLVLSWLCSGHWVLNNVLGISICVAFVSHVRLPNIKICALLLACLFVYDIFWVFFSERFFGANVMVAVATQQAQNPVHTVAHQLRLPTQSITKKLDLPVKLLFPRDLLLGRGGGDSSAGLDYMMLGLGDMAIPGMLLALVLCFDHRKSRELAHAHPHPHALSDSATAGPPPPPRAHRRYLWWAVAGYAVGLVAALAAGVLTRAPQPALLYLVPSTLGPVAASAWARNELPELWHGPTPAVGDKARLLEV
eukprot:jgi/Mesen1/2249/ME000153S01470